MAAMDFFTSTSTMAACVDAARSVSGFRRAELFLACVVNSGFLSPANEKSRFPLCAAGAKQLV
jgi:hypothetical protein